MKNSGKKSIFERLKEYLKIKNRTKSVCDLDVSNVHEKGNCEASQEPENEPEVVEKTCQSVTLATPISTALEISDYMIDQNISDVVTGDKRRVYYLFDLHLDFHVLQTASQLFSAPSVTPDVIRLTQNIVNKIVSDIRAPESILLIGGDVASSFSLYKLFIKLLRDALDRQYFTTKVIFLLGNHELWEFPQLTFAQIRDKYRDALAEYKMYLLQNDIIFIDNEKNFNYISASEILNLTSDDIRKRLRFARTIFFGGLAFSGCNEQFNALQGLYRDTITREQEIGESAKFKRLYDILLNAIPDKDLVVCTHTPMDCWGGKIDCHKNYIYMSGHTHRNYFLDNGDMRIYADNQIGYTNHNFHLKWLDLDTSYDYFSDYDDGIYQITAEDYQQFYRGKNIMLNFNRSVDVLYMLKRNGYYCFICKSWQGSLNILNGGSLKKLPINDINYYYDNMDAVVTMIKEPFDKYTSLQETVANQIRKIGGLGRIHGCIVDIDYLNHVFVNPFDLKITGYWASDIINKKIYPSVPALLEQECPSLYLRYSKLLNAADESLSVISDKVESNITVAPQTYLDTDIYSISRQFKKMQKLNSSILTVWYEAEKSENMIEPKESQSPIGSCS